MGNISEVFNEMYPKGALEKMSLQELSDLRKSIHEQEDQMINNISSHSPVITGGCLLDFADVNMSILAQMITMKKMIIRKREEILKQIDEKNMPKRKCALNPITILGKVECEFFLSKDNLLTTKTIYSVPSLFFAKDFREKKVFEHMQFLDEYKLDEVTVLGGTRLPMLFHFDFQECLAQAEEGYDWPINAGLVCLMEQ